MSDDKKFENVELHSVNLDPHGLGELTETGETGWKMDDDTRPADRRTMSTEDLRRTRDSLAFWDDIAVGAMEDTKDGPAWTQLEEVHKAFGTVVGFIDSELTKREQGEGQI